MYKFLIKNITDKWAYEELIKVFLRPDEFSIDIDDNDRRDKGIIQLQDDDVLLEINNSHSDDKNEIKREIYNKLSKLLGIYPPWGIMTGVRPVKLAGEILESLGSEKDTIDCLKQKYLLADDKVDLVMETLNYQQEIVGNSPKNSVGIYIGIPFCPTRCLYCSFTSNQKPESEIIRYLEALKKEIAYVGKRMKETGLWVESIYIGGGTPTTLTENELEDLFSTVENNIDMSKCREFTCEAGRPDTITVDKLKVMKEHNVQRISINPQSMKEKTLELIGRSHRPSDIIDAFDKAKSANIGIVNADVIAGLPEESETDFTNTLDRMIKLAPQNITVHTMTVKKASRLIDIDKDYHYKQAQIVRDMLEISKQKMKENGYRPYYLYRLKNMAGSLENVGYSKADTPCIYNIRIMGEKQTIIALGAGGVTKVFFPKENRLERVPNVSNYEVYIDRLDEMLQRKEENLFKEVIKYAD